MSGRSRIGEQTWQRSQYVSSNMREVIARIAWILRSSSYLGIVCSITTGITPLSPFLTRHAKLHSCAHHLSKSLLRSLPVQHIPDGLEVLDLAVLVLQVVGVLPCINTQDWGELSGDWVLVGVVLDRNLAGLGVLDQPSPSGSLKAGEGGVEGALELIERAVGLGNSGLEIDVSTYCACMTAGDHTLRAPDGSPPPPADFGAKFSQNRLWLMCPPPWKLINGCRETCALISPFCPASWNFSLAVLKPATYVAWCLEWWSSMILPEMAGSSAP